jgi:hypothetical protein
LQYKTTHISLLSIVSCRFQPCCNAIKTRNPRGNESNVVVVFGVGEHRQPFIAANMPASSTAPGASEKELDAEQKNKEKTRTAMIMIQYGQQQKSQITLINHTLTQKHFFEQ